MYYKDGFVDYNDFVTPNHINFIRHGIVFKDQIRVLSYSKSRFLFLDFFSSTVFEHIHFKVDEKYNVPAMIFRFLEPRKKLSLDVDLNNYRSPLEVVRSCNICNSTGVLDWIGSINNKFRGYCHETNNLTTLDEILHKSKSYHFKNSEIYKVYFIESEIRINKLVDPAYAFESVMSRGLSPFDRYIFEFFNLDLTLLEKYCANFLDIENRRRVESKYSDSTALENLVNQFNQYPNKTKIIDSIVIVKCLNESLVDPDLYKICPKCNGSGIFIVPDISNDQLRYRMRNITVGSAVCLNLGMLSTVLDIFVNTLSCRHTLSDIKRIAHYEGCKSRELFWLYP